MLGHKFQGKSITDEEMFSKFQQDSHFFGIMDEITINLQKECEEKPHSAMVEECKLISNGYYPLFLFLWM